MFPKFWKNPTLSPAFAGVVGAARVTNLYSPIFCTPPADPCADVAAITAVILCYKR